MRGVRSGRTSRSNDSPRRQTNRAFPPKRRHRSRLRRAAQVHRCACGRTPPCATRCARRPRPTRRRSSRRQASATVADAFSEKARDPDAWIAQHPQAARRRPHRGGDPRAARLPRIRPRCGPPHSAGPARPGERGQAVGGNGGSFTSSYEGQTRISSRQRRRVRRMMGLVVKRHDVAVVLPAAAACLDSSFLRRREPSDFPRTTLGPRLRGDDDVYIYIYIYFAGAAIHFGADHPLFVSERTSFLIGAGSAACCASAAASHSAVARRLGARWPLPRRQALRMQRQRKVGEAMRDRRQRLAEFDACAKALSHQRQDVVVDRAFGQAPQAAPDADVGALLEQDFATALDQQHADRALRQCLPGPRLRQFTNTVLAARHAVRRHGARVAARVRARVHSVAPRSINPCV